MPKEKPNTTIEGELEALRAEKQELLKARESMILYREIEALKAANDLKPIDKPYLQKLTEKGYPYYYNNAVASEDLENPSTEYITIGYMDSLGQKLIHITMPKEEQIMRAEYIIKKYKK